MFVRCCCSCAPASPEDTLVFFVSSTTLLRGAHVPTCGRMPCVRENVEEAAARVWTSHTNTHVFFPLDNQSITLTTHTFIHITSHTFIHITTHTFIHSYTSHHTHHTHHITAHKWLMQRRTHLREVCGRHWQHLNRGARSHRTPLNVRAAELTEVVALVKRDLHAHKHTHMCTYTNTPS